MDLILAANLLVLLLVLPSCMCAVDLDSKYSFNKILHSRYTLYWDYNPTNNNISFAVRAQTTGWVGFGISPNGGMIGSDVVIGWVQDGRSYFNDRFAVAQSTPPIDIEQDWFLTNAEEENGYTTLEFTRNYTSCDGNNQDRNITAGTSRIVWSFKEQDPPIGANGSFTAHDFKGSASVNLLGGLRNATIDPPGTKSFNLTVDQITVPSADTTYWCAGFELPQDIQNSEKYIIRFSPHVTEGNTAHVHHMLVYLCESINTTDPGGPCNTVSQSLASCVGGTLLGAWAVGGQDFIFPPNVAYALGGSSYRYHYAVIQMHYDNPNKLSDVVDSSGMIFYYIETPRQHNAGIVQVGHRVSQLMVIPPKAKNYTVFGFCSSTCTEQLPEEGLHVFANLLHTHLLGVSIKLYHLRASDQCRLGSGIEELKPIDNNPYYDFDFQEIVHVDKVTIRRGDMLLLTCTYDSTNENEVTLGGQSTHEEMCLSFSLYYPAANFTHCVSTTYPQAFTPFLSRYYNASQIASFVSGPTPAVVGQMFNNIDWTPQEIQRLQDSLLTTNQNAYCGRPRLGNFSSKPIPSVGCPYKAPSVMLECPGSIDPTSGSVSSIVVSFTALLIFMMITIMLI